MKRLTISVGACTETLGLLIGMAWADGRLDDDEKAGVRGAADVFNLGKDLRARLEELLAKPPKLEDAKLGGLSARDKAFAFVATAWLAHVDGEVDPAEQKLLGRIGAALDLDAARQEQLVETAKKLDPLPEGKRSWAAELTRLFKAIPPEVEEIEGDFEVVFQ